jgi:FlaG/FlaF family flagellin (archaellin)
LKSRICRIHRSIRAISPVISVLLIISITVVASLVAYAWVMGYLNFTSEKIGKAIQIQSTALVPTTTPNEYTLNVYVQNIGQGIITIDHINSVYINDQLQQLSIDDFIGGTPASGDKTTLNPGVTVAIHTHFTVQTSGTSIKVKIVTTEGTISESTVTPNAGTPTSESKNALQIQKTVMVQTGTPNAYTLDVYIQNIGQGSTTFDTANSLFLNDQPQNLQANDFEGKTILTPGESTTIHTQQQYQAPLEDLAAIKVKIVSTDGTLAESTIILSTGDQNPTEPLCSAFVYAPDFIYVPVPASTKTSYIYQITSLTANQIHIGYVEIEIPTGFTVNSILSLAAENTVGESLVWTSQVSGNTIILKANGASNELTYQNSNVELIFEATSPAVSGTYDFIPKVFENYIRTGSGPGTIDLSASYYSVNVVVP